jgi:hypothetical protein
MLNAGTAISRIVGGIKGALSNLQHTAYIGPKALNGGELIITAGKYKLGGLIICNQRLTFKKMADASIYTGCRTP